MSTRLEEIIRSRGMTIRQCAIAADVPYSTLYDVAKGKRPLGGMSVANAQCIAKTLGMSLEELLGTQPPSLSADEQELVSLWRQMPAMGRRMVMSVARQIVAEADDGED